MGAAVIRQKFETSGYAHFPAILLPAEVEDLRSTLKEYFQRTKANWVPQDEIFASEAFYKFPFLPQCVAAARAVLGNEFYILPDFAISIGNLGAWHRDTGTELNQKRRYIFNQDFVHVNFGLYLQNNDPMFAGGLEVVPGSQRISSLGAPLWKNERVENARDKLKIKMNMTKPLPTKAGDLAIFNRRIMHRTAHPTVQCPAHAPMRMAVFWGAVAKPEYGERYLEVLQQRSLVDDGYRRLMPNGVFQWPAPVKAMAAAAGCRLLPKG